MLLQQRDELPRLLIQGADQEEENKRVGVECHHHGGWVDRGSQTERRREKRGQQEKAQGGEEEEEDEEWKRESAEIG